MDVYFERIAGVGEREPAPQERKARRPVDPNAPLALAHDDEDTGVETASAGDRGLDEDGFPLSPMTDQDRLWFVQAQQLYRPLVKGAGTARTVGSLLVLSGVTTCLFGALALLGADKTTPMMTLVVGAIVVTLGTMERSAGGDLAALEPRAPRRLALNQLALFALVALWCAWGARDFRTAQAKEMAAFEAQLEQLPPEAAQMAGELGQLQALVPQIVYGFFGVVAAVSLLFQGGLACYYLSKRKRIREFNDELPPWVADVVQTLAVR